MTLQQVLVWFFTAASGAAVFCFVLLVQWYWRRERVERERLRKARLELAELSILFQSIREVIAENKRVAAGFSREVEARVDIVKDILLQSVARTRELYERQRKLAERIVTLEHRLNELEQAAGRISPAPFPDAVGPSRPAVTAASEGQTGSGLPSSRPRVLRPGDDAGISMVSGSVEDLSGTGLVSGKPVEPWHPTNLSGTTEPGQAPRQKEIPSRAFVELEVPGPTVSREADPSQGEETAVPSDPEPKTDDHTDATRPERVEPEGWNRVRQAFQELLDLTPDQDEGPDAAPNTSPNIGRTGTPPETASADPATGDGDQRAFEALKRRVAAYCAAGMSEEAIARELGIGRGEVRLMLSLSRLPRGG